MFFLKTLDTKHLEQRINASIERIIANYAADPTIHHINDYPVPSKKNIVEILDDFLGVLFPGFFTRLEITNINLNYYFGNKINKVFERLTSEIAKSLRYDRFIKEDLANLDDTLIEKSVESALSLIEAVPDLREILAKDIQAAFDGDPAAKNFGEIIFSYPGFYSIASHRIAHFLYQEQIPILPRIIAEYAHSQTGIDIHPGASIGEHFFVDHGSGVVIGETCNIGAHVKIYQGVTLGALSFPKKQDGTVVKGLKRHPTIEDNVTIYAGATILGGNTVIGKNSVIGGNAWIVSSVPPDSKVMLSDCRSGQVIESRSGKKSAKTPPPCQQQDNQKGDDV